MAAHLRLALSLLTCTTLATAGELKGEWPHNIPPFARYYPEDEAHVKRELAAQQKLEWQLPIGMRKMGDDPGEKFFLHYWQFEGEDTGADISLCGEADAQRREDLQDLGVDKNVSLLLPAFARHINHDRTHWNLFARRLTVRDFKCPAGTESCENIGSYLCCSSGETCINTSEGVGCCASGSVCGDNVGACDAIAGYTSCSDSEGGCCVPGASCVEGGCAFYGTATVVRTLSASTVTSRPNQQSVSAAKPTTIIVTESGLTTTVTRTVSGEDRTETVTITQPTTIVIAGPTVSACTSGFQSCPASLGGGCCRSNQACATRGGCLDGTSTSSPATAAAPPVRPTSSDTSVSAADSADASSVTSVVGCPTGFYMCSAVYLGGCCQVDRNCDTTSCPPQATTDVVTSRLTIAVGGGQAAAPTGQCASGWSTCGADVGGGCCPSGYLCSSVCLNTAPGGSNTTKQAPNNAAAKGLAWSLAAAALGSAIMMIWL